MYGPDGQENLDFRLLHVYFSTKRAQNKGVSNDEIEEEQKRQRDDMSKASESVGSWSTAGMANKKRKVALIASQRAIPSSWQRGERYPARGQAQAITPYRHSTSSGFGYNSGYNRHQPASHFPPPSPYRSQPQWRIKREAEDPVYVSPAGASAASQQSTQHDYSIGEGMFENQPYHPLNSFDADEVGSGIRAMSTGGQFRVESHGRQHHHSNVFRPRQAVEAFHMRGDSHAQVQQLLEDENLEGSLMDLEQAWKADPDLQISLSFSRDAGEVAGVPSMLFPADAQPAEQLTRRLEDLHEKICQGILAHPVEERGTLVGIVASWARELARSPLEPLPKESEDKLKATVSHITPGKKDGDTANGDDQKTAAV